MFTAKSPVVLAAVVKDGAQLSAPAPGLSPDATAEEIYRQVFGAAPPPLAEVEYPISIIGINVGDLLMRPGDTPATTVVNRDGFVALVAPFLTEAAAARLREIPATDGRVDLAALKSVGIDASFDRQRLVLEVAIDTEARSVLPLALRPRRANPAASLKTLRPAPFAAAMNVFAASTYVGKSEFADRGFSNNSINVEAFANYRGFVLESGFTYEGDRDENFTRSDTRLTYDMPERMVRFEAGDLTSPTTGLQGNPDLAGVSVYRNFDLRPYEVYRPTPTQQFRLERPARVSVYINGQFQREFRLRPGRYDLTDLPLRSAAGNDVVLEIQYDSGEVERLVFAAFYDFNLLKPGVSEFALNLGVTYDIRDRRRDYDTGNPAISAFYRRGITDYLTLGANVQADRNVAVVGGEALIATGIGSFGVIAGYNARESGTRAGAVTGFYRWAGGPPSRAMTFDLQATAAGEDFRTLEPRNPSPNYKYEAAARFGMNLTDAMRVQLSSQYRVPTFSDRSEQAHDIGLSWRTRRYGSFTASVRYDDQQGVEEVSARFGWSRPIGPGVASASYDGREDTYRATYSRSPEPGVNRYGYDASLTQQKGVREALASAVFVGNRFEANLEQRVGSGSSGGNIAGEVSTTARAATSVVYAGGKVAWARPIYDSFAIFELNEKAAQYPIAVDPQGAIGRSGRGYAAKSSQLGPAVVPDLNGYLVRSIQVEAPDAPAGVAIGGEIFVLEPTYRSGYRLSVGREGSASLIGRLTDATGEPIPFAAGYATRPGDTQTKIPVFTNAGGRFYVEGVKPGEVVSLSFESPRALRANIKVPDGVIGVVRFQQPLVASDADGFDAAPQTLEFTTDHQVSR